MASTIQKLIQAIQEIINGQIPQSTEIDPDDELGRLAEKFNEMVQVLAQREEQARQQSEKFRQLNRELIQSNQMQTEFLSDVSHELRTPLTAIKSFCDLLLMFGDDDPEVREEFLQNIVESCDRLVGLINELLDGSKIMAGKIEWDMTDIDLIEIIVNSIGVMKAMAKEKDLQFVTQLPIESIMLKGDRDRLIQVLQNLINNAVKFTSEGQITVGVEKLHHQVRVNVSDTGIGITSENYDLIFERFAQVTDPKSGKPPGTGLGLAICQQIIEYHGGKIWVESEGKDKGSTFVFTLPLSESEEPQ